MSEKYYTISEVANLLGLKPQDVTTMWLQKKFPNCKVENKVVLIPQSDVPESAKTPVIVPLVQTAEETEQFPIPEDIEQPETIDPPISQQEIQQKYSDAQRVIDAADAYANMTKGNADLYYQDKIAAADSYDKTKRETANKYYQDKIAEADRDLFNLSLDHKAALNKLNEEIADKTLELQKIQNKFSEYQKRFYELYQAASKNRSYSYQMALSDKWGLLTANVKKLLHIS